MGDVPAEVLNGGFFAMDRQLADGSAVGLFVGLDRVKGMSAGLEDRVSAGVSWTGLVPSRKRDVIGAAVTYRRPWDRAGVEEGSTAGVEGFYRFRLTPTIVLMPDLTYLSSWEGKSHDDVVVVSVQLEIEF